MKRTEFLNLLDELLELDPGTIKGNERLTDVPKWDSLAVIGFIALLDQHFSMSVPASRITACQTVADLVGLAAEKVND